MTEWLRELAGEEGARFLPVVELIEQAAADPDQADKVSVLGLTCGTGKSSATSLLIAETVHNVLEHGSENGLLVVTDRKDALKKYLNPDHMPRVKLYLQQHREKISRVDADTYEEEMPKAWQCPVLLMTYARYFSSEKKDIENRFLKWGNRQWRTWIIMDEEPPILQYITIGNSEVAEADAAIRNGLSTTMTGEDRTWCLEAWEKIRDRLYWILEGHAVRLARDGGEEYFRYKADQTEQLITEGDLDRLVSYLWGSQNTMLECNQDIYVLLDEMLKIIRKGGLGTAWRKQEGNLAMAFYAVRNNREIMTDLDSKVIILDGTAEISTAYDHEYIYKVPCDEVNVKKFPELTIRLVNQNTTKAAFSNNENEILAVVEEELRKDGENPAEFMIITHSGRPERRFRRTGSYAHTEHIGNTRGRNDLSESHRITQVGVFQMPPLMYTLQWFDNMDEKANGGESFASAVWEYPEENIDSFLRTIIREAAEPYDRKVRAAATDFEQNVFRTAIRKANNAEPVVCYLFANMDHFSWLVDLIMNRFEEKYGSTVEEPDIIRTDLRNIRKNAARRGTTAVFELITWLAEREEGEIFSKADMFKQVGLTENRFIETKRYHSEIQEWFRQMADAVPAGRPRKGYFMMLPEILEQLK